MSFLSPVLYHETERTIRGFHISFLRCSSNNDASSSCMLFKVLQDASNFGLVHLWAMQSMVVTLSQQVVYPIVYPLAISHCYQSRASITESRDPDLFFKLLCNLPSRH